jgi:hypothetical protein
VIITVILVVAVALAVTAGAFLAGVVVGTGRGEQRAAAACDIDHIRAQRPAIIWPGDLKHGIDHYEVRPVSTGACTVRVPIAADQTAVDAFTAYRDITADLFTPTGKHHYQMART